MVRGKPWRPVSLAWPNCHAKSSLAFASLCSRLTLIPKRGPLCSPFHHFLAFAIVGRTLEFAVDCRIWWQTYAKSDNQRRHLGQPLQPLAWPIILLIPEWVGRARRRRCADAQTC